MAVLYLLCGVQGAGKTTFALNNQTRLNAKVISTDEVRKLTPNFPEKDVFPTAYKLLADELNNNHNVIFDATSINKNTRARHLNALRELVKTEYQIICYCFVAPLETLEERVKNRNLDVNEHYLPIEVVSSYYKHFEMPSLDEGFNEIVIVS